MQVGTPLYKTSNNDKILKRTRKPESSARTVACRPSKQPTSIKLILPIRVSTKTIPVSCEIAEIQSKHPLLFPTAVLFDILFRILQSHKQTVYRIEGPRKGYSS